MSNLPIQQEIVRLEANALIVLYVLDATDLGGEIFRFYAGTDPNGENIVWQGNEYVQYPLEVKGFEFKVQGSLPRPSLVFSNVFGTFTSLTLHFDDLIGARIIRKRTFARFLDDQPEADPTAGFPDDIFYIERKVSATKGAVEFELASSMDVDDLSLPKRQILANLCVWKYRGAECSFAGDYPVATSRGFSLRPKTFIGAYSGAVTYNKDSVVSYLLKYYVCRIDSTRGRLPVDPTYWFEDVTNGTWGAQTNRGRIVSVNSYSKADFGYIQATATIRRYYLCIRDNAGTPITGADFMPPNETYWIADECSKRIGDGCRLRFQDNILPFGGFPATSRLPS